MEDNDDNNNTIYDEWITIDDGDGECNDVEEENIHERRSSPDERRSTTSDERKTPDVITEKEKQLERRRLSESKAKKYLDLINNAAKKASGPSLITKKKKKKEEKKKMTTTTMTHSVANNSPTKKNKKSTVSTTATKAARAKTRVDLNAIAIAKARSSLNAVTNAVKDVIADINTHAIVIDETSAVDNPLAVDRSPSINRTPGLTRTPLQTHVQTHVQTRRMQYISEFEEGSTFFNKITQREEEMSKNHLMVLNYIIGWINYRLIDKSFRKHLSGIYLWSYHYSVGKTYLCNVLSKIFVMYDWVFEDNDWQQNWRNNHHYDCIIYNALNSPLLRFRQIESHGDRKEIPVTRRNQHFCDHIKPDTPFIITSNKPVESLGYEEKDCNSDVWKERMLIICVDNCPLFPLIDKIIQQFDIRFKEENVLPEWCKLYEF